MNIFPHHLYNSNKRSDTKKGQYAAYDNTNDARFESLRNYPKRIGLYKRHIDLEKEYEHILKRYKKDQRLFISNTEQQKQKAETRFKKLKKQVINSRPYNLRYSYNWDSKEDIRFSRAHTRASTKLQNVFGDYTDVMDLPDITHHKVEDILSPDKRVASRTGCISPERPLERLKSHRSVSVDNIPQVEETSYVRTERLDGGVIYIKSELKNIDPSITRSLTSLVDHKRKTKLIEVQAVK